jgi:hypothetical protein
MEVLKFVQWQYIPAMQSNSGKQQMGVDGEIKDS